MLPAFPPLERLRGVTATFLLLLAIGLAAGCASLGGADGSAGDARADATAQAWALRQQALAARPGFRLSGRAALQSGDKGWSAQIDWLQGPSAWSMELVGPLNQGVVRIAGDAAGVLLESGDERATAPSLEALIGDSLGWRVPVEALRWWVIGLPSPAWPAEDLRLDEAGRLVDVRQGPWRLSVLAYVDDTPLALPRKLYVNGAAAELRMVIARWGELP